MDKVDILGVQIDNFSPQEILEQVNHFLHSNDQHYLVTPNPEFIVAAQQDHEFKEILNYADIAAADGVGLIKIAKLLGQRLQRVTGVDLVWLISELAEQQNCSIYLLGAAETVAAQTAAVLKENLPNLIIAGAESGGEIADPKEIDYELIGRINDSQAAILFVALGQIKQEKWIFYHLDQLPNIKVAVGIGGAFDYISGNVLRAPKILRNFGLEWLFRLILQPQRYKRILTATVVFPWLVFVDKIKKRVAPNR